MNRRDLALILLGLLLVMVALWTKVTVLMVPAVAFVVYGVYSYSRSRR
ncbi:hypothetical protein [Arsenicicoccus dermatophilus]|nr:hypothetical protein [Arsenicicoccus dermatophilus]MCH8613296.1 hypothetical protein [Arsenicicoccus dermatophilus]